MPGQYDENESADNNKNIMTTISTIVTTTSKSDEKDLGLAIGLPILFLGIIVIVVFFAFCWWYLQKRKKSETSQNVAKRKSHEEVDGDNDQKASSKRKPEIYVKTPSKQGADLYVVREAFDAGDKSQLTLKLGQIVEVTSAHEYGWCHGSIDESSGWFPVRCINKIQVITNDTWQNNECQQSGSVNQALVLEENEIDLDMQQVNFHSPEAPSRKSARTKQSHDVPQEGSHDVSQEMPQETPSEMRDVPAASRRQQFAKLQNNVILEVDNSTANEFTGNGNDKRSCSIEDTNDSQQLPTGQINNPHLHLDDFTDSAHEEFSDTEFDEDISWIECVTCYPYKSQYRGDLSFEIGESITLMQTLENGWCLGKKGIQSGWFPGSYVMATQANRIPSPDSGFASPRQWRHPEETDSGSKPTVPERFVTPKEMQLPVFMRTHSNDNPISPMQQARRRRRRLISAQRPTSPPPPVPVTAQASDSGSSPPVPVTAQASDSGSSPPHTPVTAEAGGLGLPPSPVTAPTSDSGCLPGVFTTHSNTSINVDTRHRGTSTPVDPSRFVVPVRRAGSASADYIRNDKHKITTEITKKKNEHLRRGIKAIAIRTRERLRFRKSDSITRLFGRVKYGIQPMTERPPPPPPRYKPRRAQSLDDGISLELRKEHMFVMNAIMEAESQVASPRQSVYHDNDADNNDDNDNDANDDAFLVPPQLFIDNRAEDVPMTDVTVVLADANTVEPNKKYKDLTSKRDVKNESLTVNFLDESVTLNDQNCNGTSDLSDVAYNTKVSNTRDIYETQENDEIGVAIKLHNTQDVDDFDAGAKHSVIKDNKTKNNKTKDNETKENEIKDKETNNNETKDSDATGFSVKQNQTNDISDVSMRTHEETDFFVRQNEINDIVVNKTEYINVHEQSAEMSSVVESSSKSVYIDGNIASAKSISTTMDSTVSPKVIPENVAINLAITSATSLINGSEMSTEVIPEAIQVRPKVNSIMVPQVVSAFSSAVNLFIPNIGPEFTEDVCREISAEFSTNLSGKISPGFNSISNDSSAALFNEKYNVPSVDDSHARFYTPLKYKSNPKLRKKEILNDNMVTSGIDKATMLTTNTVSPLMTRINDDKSISNENPAKLNDKQQSELSAEKKTPLVTSVNSKAPLVSRALYTAVGYSPPKEYQPFKPLVQLSVANSVDGVPPPLPLSPPPTHPNSDEHDQSNDINEDSEI